MLYSWRNEYVYGLLNINIKIYCSTSTKQSKTTIVCLKFIRYF